MYLDDILVASDTYEKHYNDVKRVMIILYSHGTNVNFAKSCFGLRRVNYFEQIIYTQEIKPDLSRIHSFTFNPSKTKKQVI